MSETQDTNSLPLVVADRLQDWYTKHGRTLPWRTNLSPYRVWVSEIMLQQTRVVQAMDYYTCFLDVFPDVETLASADFSAVAKVWEGLGYYRRARNMHRAAKLIVEECGGVFPTTYQGLRLLPGVGAYTAGAIASVCYNLPTPAVDGNVLRVVSRLLALEADIAASTTIKLVHSILEPLYHYVSNRNTLTQSLMELGAIVCVPNTEPHCKACPLRPMCRAYALEATLSFPIKSAKKEKVNEKLTVFVLEGKGQYAGKYLVEKPKTTGLLAGMHTFIHCSGHLEQAEALAYLAQKVSDNKLNDTPPSDTATHVGSSMQPNDIPSNDTSLRKDLGSITCTHTATAKHVFTHKVWHMQVYYVQLEGAMQNLSSTQQWVHLQEVAIPTAFKKLIL